MNKNKYNVDIAYSIIVEASNKDEARQIAIDKLENTEMYNNNNVDYEVCQVDTIKE